MNAPEPKGSFKQVGTRPIRPDGVEKVTGKAIFGTDYKAANMLHGAIVRSPHPHARIKSIDTSKAEAVPGVKAVVTGADFPSIDDVMVRTGEVASSTLDMAINIMAKDTAYYDGHAVAAVAAVTRQAAIEAARLVEVDYEILPHVIDINDAFAADAPKIKESLETMGIGEGEQGRPNASLKFPSVKGDPEAAMAGAAHTVSGHYSLKPVHQGYIEPHAAVATWKADGKLDIWCSSQGQFDVRGLTAGVLHLDIGNVRVMPLEIGGGFGGKTTIYLEPVAALL